MFRTIQWLILAFRQEYKYLLLFIIAFITVILNPLFNYFGFGLFLLDLLLTLIVISGINLAGSKKELAFSLIIGLIAIIIAWFSNPSVSLTTSPLALLEYIFLFIFFLYLTIRLIRQVVRSTKVTKNTLYGALTGYLLIGIMGASVASTIETLNPGSFIFSAQSNDYATLLQLFLYYSFITLSTLGYGDVLPVTPAAQSLSIALSLIGQIYLTVLVAILVGKYISNQESW
ncbi:MAG: ion channel [Prochloraceae cyanobacterium]